MASVVGKIDRNLNSCAGSSGEIGDKGGGADLAFTYKHTLCTHTYIHT